jgi:hypothetical protein
MTGMCVCESPLGSAAAGITDASPILLDFLLMPLAAIKCAYVSLRSLFVCFYCLCLLRLCVCVCADA